MSFFSEIEVYCERIGDHMIIQPDKGTRNVNDLFYEAERRRIDLLNREFFHDVELTKNENDVLVWLCGWDEWTVDGIISAFKKVGGNLGNGNL